MRMAWAMVGTSSNAEAVPPSLHHNGRRNLKTAGLLVLALALLVGVWSSYAWWKRDVPADRLCEAVVQGDVRRVEKLLMEGVSGETRFREQANGAQDGFTLYRLMQLLAGKADRGELSGETVLMRAAYLRNETIVDLLLRHGARPNTIWSQTTALAVASRRGSSQIVRRLLETGADPNLMSPIGPSPLMLASAKDHLTVMDSLIHAGAIVDTCTPTGDTALMAASANNQVSAVKRLLAAGANPQRQNDHGQTAAVVARRAGAMAAFKLLTSKRIPECH